jgi:hypothetical protein
MRRVDFSITKEFVLGVCRAAKGGDQSARILVKRWLRTNDKAREIILDFYDGKYPRSVGMPKGHSTPKGEWTEHLLSMADRHIAAAEAGHYGARIKETRTRMGTMRAAARFFYPDAAEAEIDRLLNSHDAEIDQLTKKLLDARRRGRKKSRAAP